MPRRVGAQKEKLFASAVPSRLESGWVLRSIGQLRDRQAYLMLKCFTEFLLSMSRGQTNALREWPRRGEGEGLPAPRFPTPSWSRAARRMTSSRVVKRRAGVILCRLQRPQEPKKGHLFAKLSTHKFCFGIGGRNPKAAFKLAGDVEIYNLTREATRKFAALHVDLRAVVSSALVHPAGWEFEAWLHSNWAKQRCMGGLVWACLQEEESELVWT